MPTAGPAAHAWILAHDTEAAAFAGQLRAQGVGTSLLVDTYDIAAGIETAVAAARELGASGPGAIRLDSGDPRGEVPAARSLLDRLGATETRIVVTGDLDEHTIAELAGHPVDVYGVGTQLVTGSGAPTAGMVYKLVAVEGPDGAMRPVAKRSAGKGFVGGRKWAWRIRGVGGTAVAEYGGLDPTAPPGGARPPLHRPGPARRCPRR